MFRENLIKPSIHLIKYTSFINFGGNRKDTNGMIIFDIKFALLFMTGYNASLTEQWIIEIMMYKARKIWLYDFIITTEMSFCHSAWSSLLFIKVGIEEWNTEGCSGSILLSFLIPGHSCTFQELFVGLKIFFARQLVPGGFRCKPFVPRFLALIFLLSIIYISSWRKWLVSWLNVNSAFPSSVCKVGMEITTLQLGRFSVIKNLSFRR